MSYFADLSVHTYTDPDCLPTLNIGWLDIAYPFTQGVAPAAFCDVLRDLCQRPIILHRGLHECQYCERNQAKGTLSQRIALGNGQIRVVGKDQICYAAPEMVYHYIASHNYLPPQAFIDAVLDPIAVRAADTAP